MKGHKFRGEFVGTGSIKGLIRSGVIFWGLGVYVRIHEVRGELVGTGSLRIHKVRGEILGLGA